MPKLTDGYATLSQVADLNITFGKKVKAPPKRIWKKRSIFWELKYWTHILVRHCLDVMHIEKNVCKSLLWLLLNIHGKTKDGVNARKDMLAMGIKSELAPQETNGKKYICLQLVTPCQRRIKPHFVNAYMLEELQRDIILILCQLKMYFPPSFFDVMVHLVSLIVEEIKIVAPVFLRYNLRDNVIGMSPSNVDADVIQIGGVTLIATTIDSSRMEIAKDSYYGVIEEIWELDYTMVVIPILKCKWVDNTRSGVKVDNDDFTCINLSTNGYLSDPFILAKQVEQVFYVEDPLDKRWHIVLQSKRSIVGVDDVVDEDEYNKFDELPPFSIGFQPDVALSNTIYLRSDHQEGQED
nr:hypothetical protein [Tanacetum cinerariifolium]